MPRYYALVSCAIFYTIGFLGSNSSSALIDLGRTSFELLAFYALFVLWDKEAEYKNRCLMIAGLAMGFALGTKQTSWFSFVLLLIIAFVKFFLENKSFRSSLRYISIFGLISILVVSPWMLRAFFYTGNPFYPIPVLPLLLNLFKGGRLNVLSVKDKIEYLPMRPTLGDSLSFRKILLIPWEMTVDGISFGGSGGMLSIFYLAFLPFVIFIRKINKDILLMLAFCFVWLGAGITTLPFRHLYPVWALLSVVTTYVVYRLVSGNLMQKPVTIVIGILLLLNFYIFVPITKLGRTMEVVFGKKTTDSYLSEVPNMYYYSAFRYINNHLPSTAKIYYIGDYQIFYCD